MDLFNHIDINDFHVEQKREPRQYSDEKWAKIKAIKKRADEALKRRRLVKSGVKLPYKYPDPNDDYVERTVEDYKEWFSQYPSEDDGYMKSFDYNDQDSYLPYLDKYGFVVIKLLSKEECDATIKSMFSELNAQSTRQISKLKVDDPNTWIKRNWPTNNKFLTKEVALTQEAFDNRQNPKLHYVFSKIFKTKKLYCSVDNWGLMRGTKGLKLKNEETGKIEVTDMPKYFKILKPHWDINPWMYTAEKKKGIVDTYQGLVALVNCDLKVGSFKCLPGSHKYIHTYAKEHYVLHRRKTTVRPKLDKAQESFLQSVPLRRGELVIFNGALIHCNYGNTCDRMRLIQFLRMLPATKASQDADRYASKRVLRLYTRKKGFKMDSVKLTKLGKKLCGVEEWTDQDENDENLYNDIGDEKEEKDEEKDGNDDMVVKQPDKKDDDDTNIKDSDDSDDDYDVEI